MPVHARKEILGVGDTRQPLQKGLARWNYNKDGNIVFRHIFCRKCAIAKEAIREYNLKSPHYGTLI